MNNKLFNKHNAPSTVPADTTNAAGGIAYSLTPKEALAQLACTSFFGNTFYVSAEDQLEKILEIAGFCDDLFVLQVARYARRAGYMKDTPAVLLAYLFGKNSAVLTDEAFNSVIDNVKMLSNFVQAVRSGKLGRKSLGTKGKRLVSRWLTSASDDYLWRQSVAKSPSLGDLIYLSRTKPTTPSRQALHALLLGKELNSEQTAVLPELVKQTLAFQKDPTGNVPPVPFNMIDSVPMNDAQWLQVFANGGWTFTRMNLNTAERHGVFKSQDGVRIIAERLKDPAQVAAAKVFPFQILLAYKAAMENLGIPPEVRSALHDAMELATINVPALRGRVVVAVDCSGSMDSRIANSVATYADAAALFAATLLRRNPQTKVMTFADDARYVAVEPRDSVLTTAAKLAEVGGGTDTSAPLRKLAFEKTELDVFILISDNQGWMDAIGPRGQTSSSSHWDQIKKVNPNARQIRINIDANATDQIPERKDTLRVGGFSDAVFTAIANWLENRDWVASVSSFSG